MVYYVQFRRLLFGRWRAGYGDLAPLEAFLRSKWIYREDNIHALLKDSTLSQCLNEQDQLLSENEIQRAVEGIEDLLFAAIHTPGEWLEYLKLNPHGRLRLQALEAFLRSKWIYSELEIRNLLVKTPVSEIEPIEALLFASLREPEQWKYYLNLNPEGRFRAEANTRLRSEPRALKVFLCHGSEDKPRVMDIHRRLLEDGVDPWLDKKNILGGEKWEFAIKKAVRECDIILVCFSPSSVNRSGYLHAEIKQALDIATEKPEHTIYIIPVKLAPSDIPDRLREWHCIDYFTDDGYQNIQRSLAFQAARLGCRELLTWQHPVDR